VPAGTGILLAPNKNEQTGQRDKEEIRNEPGSKLTRSLSYQFTKSFLRKFFRN
jgi:hypothetical protein